MIAARAYTEFLGADGVIKGKDYSGKLPVQGDSMCFQYGQDPETCWQVKIDGDQVTWLKIGKVDGTVSIVKGNPNRSDSIRSRIAPHSDQVECVPTSAEARARPRRLYCTADVLVNRGRQGPAHASAVLLARA